MSTRSALLFTGLHKYGGPETVRVYKHTDGYPTPPQPKRARGRKARVG